jgi:hypothetical protein
MRESLKRRDKSGPRDLRVRTFRFCRSVKPQILRLRAARFAQDETPFIDVGCWRVILGLVKVLVLHGALSMVRQIQGFSSFRMMATG